ncbi:TPA: isopentenyl phosphate kinase family protein, partial [Candidatus Bathyarchaeota archaeon]|nr:isopentenyl phosphate kinase family protein [Candidatus Bathyarchaeota archaeon]
MLDSGNTSRTAPAPIRWNDVFENRPLLIKLGGSAITDKTKEFAARTDVIENVCLELSKAKQKIVVIHGAGSFGHPIVERYKLAIGYRSDDQLKGFLETKMKLYSLNRMVVECLIKRGVRALPFQPLTFMTARKGKIRRMEVRPLINALKLGFTPVLYGDIIFDEVLEFSIASGDQIASKLAPRINAKAVIFGCDVDGIFTADPKRDPNARLIPTITLTNLKEVMRM